MLKSYFKHITILFIFSCITNVFGFDLQSYDFSQLGGARFLKNERILEKFPGLIPIYTIVKDTQTGDTFLRWCTASIVSDNVLITSAHCFEYKAHEQASPVMFNYMRASEVIVKDSYTSSTPDSTDSLDEQFNNNLDHINNDLAVVIFPEGSFRNFKQMKLSAKTTLKPGDSLTAVGMLIVDDVSVSKIMIDVNINEASIIDNQVLIALGIKGLYPRSGYSGGPIVLQDDPDTLVGILSGGIVNTDLPSQIYSMFNLLITPSKINFLKSVMKEKNIYINGLNFYDENCTQRFSE